MEAAAPLRGLNPPVPKLGIQLDRTSGFTKRCKLENLRPNRSFQFFDHTGSSRRPILRPNRQHEARLQTPPRPEHDRRDLHRTASRTIALEDGCDQCMRRVARNRRPTRAFRAQRRHHAAAKPRIRWRSACRAKTARLSSQVIFGSAGKPSKQVTLDRAKRKRPVTTTDATSRLNPHRLLFKQFRLAVVGGLLRSEHKRPAVDQPKPATAT